MCQLRASIFLQVSSLAGHLLVTWHWSRQKLSRWQAISSWGNTLVLGRKSDKGRGQRGHMDPNPSPQSDPPPHTHCPSPGFTNRRAACLSGSQGTLEEHLHHPLPCSPTSALGSEDLNLGSSPVFSWLGDQGLDISPGSGVLSCHRRSPLLTSWVVKAMDTVGIYYLLFTAKSFVIIVMCSYSK